MKITHSHPGFAIILSVLFSLLRSTVFAQTAGITRQMVILPVADTFVSKKKVSTSLPDELYVEAGRSQGKTDRNSVTYLHFNLGALPPHATVTAATLVISLKQITDPEGDQEIFVYDIKGRTDIRGINWDNQPAPNGFAAESQKVAHAAGIDQEYARERIVCPLDRSYVAGWQSQRGSNIVMMLGANAEQCTYYSSRVANATLKPRLVISYILRDTLEPAGWAQFRYNAAHTAQNNWTSNAAIDTFAVRKMYAASQGNIMGKPLLYEGHLLFAFQSNQQPMHRLYDIDETGGAPLASGTNLNAIVKWSPVIDSRGNIYCFTGQTSDSLKVYSVPMALKQTYAYRLTGGFHINADPVIGTDGSLYISTDSGIYAYTPCPDFRLKWRYAVSGTNNYFGTVTLNAREDTVFVCQSVAGKSGNLIAVSNIDGRVLWTTAVADGVNSVMPEKNIPVPLAKNGKLYFTDGLVSGKNFFILDGTGSIIARERAIENAADISCPVASGERVFVISNHVLKSWNIQNEQQDTMLRFSGLSAASTIVSAGNQGLYILHNSVGDQSLISVWAKDQYSRLPLPTDKYGNLYSGLLVLTPSGALITGNTESLYRMYPKSFTERQSVNIPGGIDFETEHVYRSVRDISVEGRTLARNQQIIIQSLNGIRFQKNFRVQKGARLQCKTGK